MDIEKECLYLYLPKLQKVLIILNIQLFLYVLFQSWTIKDVHYIPYSVQQYLTNKSMWNISSSFGNIKKLKIDDELDEKPKVPMKVNDFIEFLVLKITLFILICQFFLSID